ncbi:MAG: hypothetical protein A2283_22830 [Lentisphaerae bacterium RIFOXYA12_FULL_48_11]|nr:MAG: hypothetical protein A2283_22830 [Lentisphaerae bacterium RIFOXYA12_FULL_48_11]
MVFDEPGGFISTMMPCVGLERKLKMNIENAIRTAIGFFCIILIGSLVSAIIGGGFGALVATISPEFVDELLHPKATQTLTRYAFAVGMIWGLFIGAAVSGFACFLAAVLKILRIRFENQKDDKDKK